MRVKRTQRGFPNCPDPAFQRCGSVGDAAWGHGGHGHGGQELWIPPASIKDRLALV